MGEKNYFPLGVFFKFLVLYLYCSLSLWQLINLAICSFQTSLFSQFPDIWNYLPVIILCVESSPNIIKSPEICQMGQIMCFKVKKQTNNLTEKQENYLCTLLSEHFGNFPYILFSVPFITTSVFNNFREHTNSKLENRSASDSKSLYLLKSGRRDLYIKFL